MAGSILKGISVIKSVSPKVKNKSVSTSKGRIAKNVGQIKKIQDEREEIMEVNLKRAKEGKGSIYGTVEETEKEIEKLRGEKKKFPSKMMRNLDEGLEFETTSEYSHGGLVKKGFPKIAKKGWK
jgi:predicted RNase H-like nuclease (RuvC/YqgF family)